MKIINKNRKKRTKILLSWVITIVAISAGYFVLAKTFGLTPFTPKNSSTTEVKESDNRGVNEIDYSGPSKVDLEQSQNGKKNTEQKNPVNQGSAAQQADVLVAVSFADKIDDHVEIRAFIPNFIEGNGTCTASLTRNGLTVTKSSPAFIDVSSSQCEPIYIPISEFSSRGEWKLVVSYKSTQHTGKSDEIKVSL